MNNKLFTLEYVSEGFNKIITNKMKQGLEAQTLFIEEESEVIVNGIKQLITELIDQQTCTASVYLSSTIIHTNSVPQPNCYKLEVKLTTIKELELSLNIFNKSHFNYFANSNPFPQTPQLESKMIKAVETKIYKLGIFKIQSITSVSTNGETGVYKYILHLMDKAV